MEKNVVDRTLKKRWAETRNVMWKHRWLYILMLPGVVYFIIYKYIPISFLLIAFKDYHPVKGLVASNWVGLKHFIRLFTTPDFMLLFKNTLIFGLMDSVCYFPLTIVLALLLNEVRHAKYKRTVQTITYIPHFFSWVVIYGITKQMLSTEMGVVNEIFDVMGLQKIPFLMDEGWYRPMIILQRIWKDIGWGSIIFLAALAGVDPQLYESSYLDGANRWQRVIYITLPSIRSTIMILLILRLGRFMEYGFEQIIVSVNAMNRAVGEVFNTYIYRVGIQNAQFSYTTAVGVFKSVVSLILVLSSNWLAKKMGDEGVF